MDNHTHQFIKVSELTKATESKNVHIYGAEVVCALCGDVRHVFADGSVKEIVTNA